MNPKFPKEENPDPGNSLEIIFKNQRKLSLEEKDRLWYQIGQTMAKEKRRRNLVRASSVVLSLTAVLLLGFGALHLLDEDVSMEKFLENIQVDNSGEIQLLLSDDNTIFISEDESSIIYKEDGKIDIKSIEDLDIHTQTEGYNTLIVPYGKRSKLRLHDGTNLWLNSGSKLVYPVSFNKSERRVYLEGEAYFEVARNENKPFIVETSGLDIRVLGTAFNVTSYKNEPSVSAVLVEGIVELIGNKKSNIKNNKTLLEPNDRLVYIHGAKNVTVKKVNIERYISWKDGYLSYKKSNLGTVAKELSRYYNININFTEPDLVIEKITGRLDLKQDAEEVIKIICNSSSLNFTKSERGYMIGRKL